MRYTFILWTLFCVGLLLSPSLFAELTTQDAAAAVGQVQSFDANPGAYHGSVSLLDSSAVALAAGADNRVMCALAEYGKGRVIAFAHTSYSDTQAPFFQNAELITNLSLWLTRQTDKTKITFIAPYAREVANLKAKGFQARQLTANNLMCDNCQGSIFILYATSIPDYEVSKIQRFVQNGGALWITCTPWAQMDSRQPEKFVGNKLLAPMGLVFSPRSVDVPEGKFAIPAVCSPFVNRATALKALNSEQASKLSKEDFMIITDSIIASIGLDDSFDLSKSWNDFQKWDQELQDVVKTEVCPSDAKKYLRLIVAWQNKQAERTFTNPDKVPTITAADKYPGAPLPDTPVVDAKVEINTSVPEWASTGLYAAPGAVITVTVPAEVAKKGDFGLRIGCHRDMLWALPQWRRYPSISLSTAINGQTTTVKSAFGGLIYIEVPYRCDLGTVEIEISGAVKAPLFVLGKTTPQEWEQMKKLGAPWGELASSKMILSVPQEVIQRVDNPEAVMKHWDAVLDADAVLTSRPLNRVRPERMVPDIQISAGWMHSGYPVMTHFDDRFGFVSGKGDNWGFYHELGHNHQSGDWTFSGAGEVTVNWFTLYCFETVDKNPQDVPGGRMSPDECAKLKNEYLKNGAKWEQWQKSPFLALVMYIELKQKYGWDAFIKTIAQYNNLSNGDRPATDQEKRDQFMIRFSRTVGKNLAPFFDQWGMITTPQAKEAIKDLPPE